MEYRDDGSGVWKKLHYDPHEGDMEAAAYRLDRLLGLDIVPETLYCTIGDKQGTVQRYIDGAETAYSLDIKMPVDDDIRNHIPREFKERMLVLDCIIAT